MNQAAQKFDASIPDLPSYPEERLEGTRLSPGIAMGPAYLLENVSPEVSEYPISEKDVEAELKRFERARKRSYNQIAQLLTKTETFTSSESEEITLLLEAHLGMLYGSRLVRGVEDSIRKKLINAESAVRTEIDSMRQTFANLDDSYIANRGKDIADVGKRLLRNLSDQKYTAMRNIPEGGILLSHDITPTDLAAVPEGRVAGFMTMVGARQGHTGIMARSLGLPAISAIAHMPKHIHADSYVIVDGSEGLLIVNPKPETWHSYVQKKEKLAAKADLIRQMKDLPAQTSDQVAIRVMANLSHGHDIKKLFDCGAAGVGLVRTEFMFMGRDDLPDAEEQYDILRTVIEGAQGLPVTIRTMDIGGDKKAPGLHKKFGIGPNPALGMRAVRLSLFEPRLLETQFEAILRAAYHGPVNILIPMISSIDEINAVKKILQDTSWKLKQKGEKVPDELPPVGIMIEIPAAALMAEQFAGECDFFSIGTNDLVQYTLAADRADEAMGAYYNPAHPAVIHMIQLTIQAAKKAKIPISICGELAGDPTMLPLFVAMGFREFSAQPSLVPEIKEWIRMMDTRRLKKAVKPKNLLVQEGVYETLKNLAATMDKIAH